MSDIPNVPPAVAEYAVKERAAHIHNLERLAAIIAEVVNAVGIEIPDDANLGPGPDICSLGDEAVTALKSLRARLAKYEDADGRPLRAVVFPGREVKSVRYGYRALGYAEGWNACLDEVARLNSSPVSAGEPVYQFQCREIGEGWFEPCDYSRYLYCQKSPEHDTRVVQVGVSAGGVDERAAFEQLWQLRGKDDEGNLGDKPLRSLVDDKRYRGDAVNGSFLWFQRGAEWQRATLSAPSHGEQVRDRYTCIGKGGDYQLLGVAQGAGTLKGLNHMVYRNVDGVMFVREPEDFLLRMEKIARAPLAGSQEQGE